MSKNYITRDDVYNQAFMKAPTALFSDQYKNLSANARCLYILLLERSCLSLKNHFMDSDNRVYVFFTREELTNYLPISLRTAIKIFKELAEFQLIEDIPQGKTKANKIYVLMPEESKKDVGKTNEKKQKRKSMLKKKQETVRKLNTDIKIKRALLKQYEEKLNKAKPSAAIDEQELQKIKQQIEYDFFLKQYNNISHQTLDALIQSIAEMQTTGVSLGGIFYAPKKVKEILKELNSSVLIKFFDEVYSKLRLSRIRNLKAYLKVTLLRYIENLSLSLTHASYAAWDKYAHNKPSYNLEEIAKLGLFAPAILA